MNPQHFTPKEREDITKYFGDLAALTPESFKKIKKQLQAKYHPDNFEKFDDETVQEMATERFQQIEKLADKIQKALDGPTTPAPAAGGYDAEFALFAFDKMKIEIMTRHKDLKYHLFGSRYRWLAYGESFKIPGTKAKIITDESYKGQSMGYVETVRIYLSFGKEDEVTAIATWLFEKLEGNASMLIIEGKKTKINFQEISHAIKKTAFVGIEAPK
ncbi:MAG: hypothetical protein AB8G15_05535 [Saprospiraceae bacterium]